MCDASEHTKCGKMKIFDDPLQYISNYTKFLLFLVLKNKYGVDNGPLTLFLLNYVEFNKGDGNSNALKKVFICKPRFV